MALSKSQWVGFIGNFSHLLLEKKKGKWGGALPVISSAQQRRRDGGAASAVQIRAAWSWDEQSCRGNGFLQTRLGPSCQWEMLTKKTGLLAMGASEWFSLYRHGLPVDQNMSRGLGLILQDLGWVNHLYHQVITDAENEGEDSSGASSNFQVRQRKNIDVSIHISFWKPTVDPDKIYSLFLKAFVTSNFIETRECAV